jgi:tetratricopeptide (TPR) repeat protein
MYPEAADILTASARGSRTAAQLIAQANSIRNVRPFDARRIATDSPGALVKGFSAAIFSSDASAEYLGSLFSKQMAGPGSKISLTEQVEQGRHAVHPVIARSGLSPRVMADLIASNVQTSEDRNGDEGYRVRLTVPGSAKTTFYVVRERGQLRILGSKDSPEAIGGQAIADVESGKLTEARQWLDWVREEIPLGGGDDPLSGPAFSRLWTKGSQAGDAAIRTAAATLIGMTSAANEALPQLREAVKSASDEKTRTAAELALVRALRLAESVDGALPAAQALVQSYPDSAEARQLLLSVYLQQRDWKSFEAMANKRLAEDATDVETSRLVAQALEEQGEFAKAEALYAKLANSAEGNDLDWNQFGWSALVAGDVTAEKIAQVQRDATAHPNLAALLHTLASMYAEAGQTAEAREVILAAMEAWGIDEPSSECWYVFGRIAEQFGVREAALADYARVPRPDRVIVSGASTYSIAQRRIAFLSGAGH